MSRRALTPAEGDFWELPAGGKAPGQIACRVKYTTWGEYVSKPPENSCLFDPAGIHGTKEGSTRGTAIGIAYTSDENTVQPEDFVVISVLKKSGYDRDVEYSIPEFLPLCPPGGCLCLWDWIHGPEHGSDEMFMTYHRCKVVNTKTFKKIGKPKPPVPCRSDRTKCVKGAKNPIYWVSDRGNVAPGWPEGTPPYLDADMGYMEGAQTDIFEGPEQPVGGGGGGGGASSSAAKPSPSKVAKVSDADNLIKLPTEAVVDYWGSDEAASSASEAAPSDPAPSKAAPSDDQPAPPPPSSPKPGHSVDKTEEAEKQELHAEPHASMSMSMSESAAAEPTPEPSKSEKAAAPSERVKKVAKNRKCYRVPKGKRSLYEL